jgi:hypothetical protein
VKRTAGDRSIYRSEVKTRARSVCSFATNSSCSRPLLRSFGNYLLQVAAAGVPWTHCSRPSSPFYAMDEEKELRTLVNLHASLAGLDRMLQELRMLLSTSDVPFCFVTLATTIFLSEW